MAAQREKVRRTGLIFNSIFTMSTAVALTAIIPYITGEGTNVFENPGRAFDGLYDAIKISELTASEFDFSTLLVFGVWAFSGLVAGVRAKSAGGGFLASVLGASLGVILIVMGVSLGAIIEGESTVDLPNLDDYMVGVVFVMLFAALFGIGAGRATTPRLIPTAKAKPKKIWKKEDRWNCRKCGSSLPPGALECPNCGFGVME